MTINRRRHRRTGTQRTLPGAHLLGLAVMVSLLRSLSTSVDNISLAGWPPGATQRQSALHPQEPGMMASLCTPSPGARLNAGGDNAAAGRKRTAAEEQRQGQDLSFP